MASSRPTDLEHLARLSSLDDPVRRRLYAYASESDAPVSREQAAAVAEIGRTLAAYHLDKLVEAGLLTASYRPHDGHSVGRPAKMYRRANHELSVSVPPRDYALLARVLATAVQADHDGTVRRALHEAAHQAGINAAANPPAELMDVLQDSGYQPHQDTDGRIALRNCPFHAVADQYRDVVCNLNVQLVQGAVDASATTGARVELDPQPGRCCVVVHGQAGCEPG